MPDKHFAVLIGNGEFLPEEHAQLCCLKCPVNDVKGLSELLRSPLHGPYEVRAVEDKNYDEILEAVDETLDQATPDDLVLVYYSGHGCLDIDGKLYLAARNTRTKALRRSAVSIDHVTESIRRSRAESTVLILDCCYSGAVEKSVGRKGTAAHSVRHALPARESATGTYILTASTAYQIAVEKAGDKYSLLTKHIIAGISGGAADKNADGVVTMDELRQYVQEKIKAEGQQPEGWALKLQGGELEIAKTGRDVSGERRNQCLPLVYRAALEHHVPLRTIRPLLNLLDENPGLPQQTLRGYGTLVDRLYRKRDSLSKFIEELHVVSDELRRIDESTNPSAWVQLRKERDAALKDLKRARTNADQLDAELKTFEKQSAKEKEKAEREVQRLSDQLKEQRSSSRENSGDTQRMIKQIREQKAELRELKEVKQENDRLKSRVSSLESELEGLKKIRTDRARAILQNYISRGILFEAAREHGDFRLALDVFRPWAVDSKTEARLKFFGDHLEYSSEPKLALTNFAELSNPSVLGRPSKPLRYDLIDQFKIEPPSALSPYYSTGTSQLMYRDFSSLTFKVTRSGVSISDGRTIESAVDPEKLVEILNALKNL